MAPILSITPHLSTARRLALVWGVHSTVIDHDVKDVDEMVDAACRTAFTEGFAGRATSWPLQRACRLDNRVRPICCV